MCIQRESNGKNSSLETIDMLGVCWAFLDDSPVDMEPGEAVYDHSAPHISLNIWEAHGTARDPRKNLFISKIARNEGKIDI